MPAYRNNRADLFANNTAFFTQESLTGQVLCAATAATAIVTGFIFSLPPAIEHLSAKLNPTSCDEELALLFAAIPVGTVVGTAAGIFACETGRKFISDTAVCVARGIGKTVDLFNENFNQPKKPPSPQGPTPELVG